MAVTKTKTKGKQATVESKKSLLTSSLTNYSLSDFGSKVVINNAQLYDLYRQNPDIRQAVKKKSQYVGKKGVIIKDKSGESLDEAKQSEQYRVMKRILNNPTFEQTKLYMMRDFDVAGEIFITPTFNAYMEVSGIHVVDPRMIQKNVQNGVVVGYTQYANYGAQGTTQTVQYTADPEKATMKTPLMCNYLLEKHTKSEFMGMGLLESVVWDALSDLEASKRNFFFFQNNMTPPSIFLLDKDAGESEANILKEQLTEQYRGSHNSHKPLIGAGVEDVKVLSVSPKDMEHINQKKMTTDKVASCFGVPKFILGYTESVNLSNGDGQRREFMQGTIEPYQCLFNYVLNDFFQKCNQAKSFIKLPKELLVKGTREYTVELYSDDIDTDIEEDKVRLEKLKNGVITINEYRIEDGMTPFINMEYADKPLIPKTVVPLEDIAFAYTPNMNE